MTREEAIVYGNDYYADLISACCKIDEKHKEFVRMSLEALEQEPCEDCISRTQAIKAMDELENEDIEAYGCSIPEGFDGERARQAICLLPSIQPTAKENLVVEDCISREFIEIVVNYPPADLCTYPEYKGKPYYSILYRDEDSRNHVGFGTYKIEMLSQWIKEYFIPSIQPKPKTDEPMQVELEGDGYADGKLVYDYGKCPKCGWEFEYGDKDWEEPYCCHCGQKLHWFESEDEE